MSTLKICRMCLRTDVELRELTHSLSDFYEELCDYTIETRLKLYSCGVCESTLKNFYHFKKQCRKSENILHNWRKQNAQDRSSVKELHKYLNKILPNQNVSTEVITTEIKTELLASDDEACNTKTNYESENTDDHIDISDNTDDEKGDDEDDKYLSEYMEMDKEETEDIGINKFDGKVEEVTELIKNDKSINIKSKEKAKRERKQRVRKRLANQDEFETVFDIEIFPTEADAIREFQQRRTSERYINAKYKCEECYTVYKSQKWLDVHSRWHMPSAGDVVCKICFMRFKEKYRLQKHRKHTHVGLFKCKRCPLVTYHKTVMENHFKKHQGVLFKCKHCSGVYNHKSTYMTHLRTRHRTNHECVYCARTFVSEKGLLVHKKRVHSEATTLDSNATATCVDCKITFATPEVYTVHVLNTPKHKDIASSIIGCQECGLQFPSKMEVREHRRKTHPSYNYGAKNRLEGKNEDDRIVQCPLCPATGNHNWWLYRHCQTDHPHTPYEQMRNDNRKHLCDECGKSFLSKTALTEHKYLHSGLKPFSCDKCPAKFRTNMNLKMHMERHLPPTRECQHCGKKFNSASNLGNHMRSHIGDRRYKCEICFKGFLHNFALKEHVRGVHHHIRRTRKQKAVE